MMPPTVEPAPPATRFFGQFLLARGLITAQQLIAAVEYQNKYNSRSGEIAVALGMVTPYDAEQINALQLEEDLLFGEAAIRLGLLSESQVSEVLSTQKDGHVRLGQALQTLGYVDAASLDSALSEFMTEEANRLDARRSIPADFPGKELARCLSALAPKMLLRTWHLPTKADALRRDLTSTVLSDINAAAHVSMGDQEARLLLGVPYAAAHKVCQARRAKSGGQEPNLQTMACDFLDLVCTHVISARAEQGQRLRIEPARAVASRVQLSQDQHALILPLLSQLGRVVVGVVA